MGLRQQEEQCALAMIFGGRPGALEAIGKYLAGLIADLPPPAKALTPDEDHFEHADELGPLLLAISQTHKPARASPVRGTPDI